MEDESNIAWLPSKQGRIYQRILGITNVATEYISIHRISRKSNVDDFQFFLDDAGDSFHIRAHQKSGISAAEIAII